MEIVTKIIPLLWNIMGDNKKCAANITTKENEIIVSILCGKRWKRFNGFTVPEILSKINKSFQIA